MSQTMCRHGKDFAMDCYSCELEQINVFASLEAECERLKTELADRDKSLGAAIAQGIGTTIERDKLKQEVDRLKAEVRAINKGAETNMHMTQLALKERNAWKARAEKLAEDLKYVVHSGESYERVQEVCEASLADYAKATENL